MGMSCEFYNEPAWAADDGDDVCVFYQKTVGRFSVDESATTRLKAKRKLRMRSDVATAQKANGGMWVRFVFDKDSPCGANANTFSGMRLEVLDASDPEWLHVRCHSEGDGWVQ